jgi:hypothetical protein
MRSIPSPWGTLVTILESGRFPLTEGIDFVQQQESANCQELLQYLSEISFTVIEGQTKRYRFTISISLHSITKLSELPLKFQRNFVVLLSHIPFKFLSSNLHDLITRYLSDLQDESLKSLSRSILFQISRFSNEIPKQLSMLDTIFS